MEARRVRKIDLLKVAMDYAKDFTYNLDISDSRKKEIELKVGHILLNAYYSYDSKAASHAEIISYINEMLSDINELKDDLEDCTNHLFFLVQTFKKDYEVKNGEAKVSSSVNILERIKEYLVDEKKQLLKSFFNVNLTNDNEINLLWEQLSFFKDPMLALLDEPKFKRSVLDNQANFCKYLGASGQTSMEIVNDAKNKGVLPSSDKIISMEKVFKREIEKKFLMIREYHTNLDYIFKDIEEKGIDLDEKLYATFLLCNRNLTGVQLSDYEGKPVCIIFKDTDSLYSNNFIDTYFHEIIHYCGGVNPLLNKYRLVYNGDVRYTALDEAFTNYLSKECYKEYFDKYTYFNNLIDIQDACTYDCTLTYMKEVCKLYKDVLLEVHFSNSLSLIDVKRKFPIEQIANSVYKIKNTDAKDLDKVTKAELDKLNRGRK